MKSYYYLLFVFLIISNILKVTKSDFLSFIGPIDIEDNSFFDQSVWSPQKIPTFSDSLLIGNGATCWITPYDSIALSNSLKITNDSVLALTGDYGIDEKFELFGGNLIMALRSNLLAGTITAENSTILIQNFFTHINDFDYDAIVKDTNITISSFATLLVHHNSTFSLDNSSLTVINNGYVGIGENTKFYLTYPLIMNDVSLMECIGGVIWINKFDCFLESEMKIFDSNITFFDTVNFYDYSKVSFIDTRVLVLGNINSYGNVTTIVYGGSLLLNGDYKLRDSSRFLVNGKDTMVFVRGEFSNIDDSIFYLNQSQFLVYGHASFSSQSYFDSGLFVVNNIAIWNGWVLGNYTNFVVNGSLVINTSYASMVESHIVSIGDITVNGILTTTNTRLYVDQGNFIVSDNAILQLIGSEARINSGQLKIHPLAYIDIVNSSFTLITGNVDTLGNVYLDSSSDLSNQNGTYNLYSGIYYTNDTTVKSNNVTVLNDGVFNVANNSVQINVAFTNSGNNSNIAQLNINNNTLFIYDFKNENGGEITLNGGTFSSDNSIQLNGGSIKGSGSFNTSINQSNGQFGSKSTVNNFNITGDFIQSNNSNNNTKIIIVIDSLDSFSTLNIGNLADINGIIEIRINQDILKNLNNNNNNNNNLESNLSSQSGSSSDGIKSASFNLISYNSKTSNSFNNIQFKSYDPKSGSESDIDKNSCIQPKSKSGSSSFSVLLEQNEDCANGGDGGGGKSKISGGAIAGIVIGCAVLAIIIISTVHYRERLRLFKINTSRKIRSMSVKLTKK
ncbi:hypothetical protein DDB_G0274473 [Dictyostelium discoideum AX4]|uniref:Transmembrane protein n=1 Tax=Dictyostelium discoideum TaxID=44689 RepID=Q86HQ6_DICDI|nr:hypothetical protein DDB_G0274473 [Dictyostelium discoideum AX4]EAL70129.1 hypothetical protein DDB_G0274473 [Dictyostelium discoideum AX4]|eukprot:XP_644148.1 hypothetical protein DDB_G0274473 [Dictyostelium discoideum AX4]